MTKKLYLLAGFLEISALTIKQFKMKRKILLTTLFSVLSFLAFTQNTNSTVPPLAGGNGSAGCTFNLTVNSPITLTEIGQAFQTSNSTYQIWYTTTPINGQPDISAAGGWTQLQTGNVTGLSANINSPVISSIPLNTPLVLAPGTYGFYIGGTSAVYTTYSGGVSAYSDAFTTIETGTNVGYGGSVPNPINHPRQFNGSVTYVPLSSTPDDIALNSIVTPNTFCAGAADSLTIQVTNYGTTQIDSFEVVWDFNSVLDSAWIYVPLDTFQGSGSTSAIINVASLTMPAGNADITVWTRNPNGNTDGDQTNDTVSVSLSPSMSGTYIIDGSGSGDYLTFTDAVNDLVANGVCGPVELSAVVGTYNEQISIPEITGSSSINTITLNSVSGAAFNTTITYAATGTADNYTVRLDGADFIRLKQLGIASAGTTYGRAVVIENGAHNNIIDSCLISADQSVTSTSNNMSVVYSTSGDLDSSNVISNNQIQNGSYGLYFYGGSTTNLAPGTVVEGNYFIDNYVYGMRLYYQDAPVIRNNYVSLSGAYTTGSNYGIYCGYCDNDVEISGNMVLSAQRGYGIYMLSCDGSMVNRGNVFNNSVSVGDSTSTSATGGIYLSSSDFQNLMFNSINTVGNGTTNRGLYISGTDNEVYNNNIANNGGNGYAVYYSSGVDASENNNLYAPNTNLGYSGAAQATFTDWQTNTGFDLMSYNVDPAYYSWDTLKTCADELNNTAMANPMVTTDVLGEVRGSMPDIGAYEFEGVANFTLGADTSLCNTASITLGEANSASTWNWSNGATTNTITVTGADAGIYAAERISECGTTQDTIEIINIPDPVASFTSTSSYLTEIFTSTSTGATSWSWDFGDGNTSTMENPIHVYAWKGEYVVTLTVTGECGTSVFTDTVDLDVVGIDENEALDFNIYPNPTTGELNITFATTVSNGTIQVIDATGRLLMERNIQNSQLSLDLSGFENGMYFIKSTSNGISTTKRVVKK